MEYFFGKNSRLWWELLLPFLLPMLYAAMAIALKISDLQWFSLLMSGGAVFVFGRCCAALAPGTHTWVRAIFTALTLGLSPVFVRAAISGFDQMTNLFLLLSAVWGFVRFFDFRKKHGLFQGAFFLALWLWKSVPLGEIEVWGAANFSKTSPGNSWPNLVSIFFPACHFLFFALAALLFFIVKKTDFQLFMKKTLLAGWLVFSVFMAGRAKLELADLLPGFSFFLLLLFPAWDRFVCYGFYFLKKRWMRLALIFVAVWQFGFAFSSLKINASPSGSFHSKMNQFGKLPDPFFNHGWCQAFQAFD